VSPSPNSSHEGRTSKDLAFRHAHAPMSALKFHGFQARQLLRLDWTPAPAPFSDQDQDGSRMTALPLPRARRLTDRGSKLRVVLLNGTA
jgi:hypothetical protein